jgi:hypothetical protein
MQLYYDSRIADDAANRPLLVFVVLDQPHKRSRVAECTKYRLLARANGIHLLADIATLGFAISSVTSASVALADCFEIFLLDIYYGAKVGVTIKAAPDSIGL